jgi:hypothetical protein
MLDSYVDRDSFALLTSRTLTMDDGGVAARNKLPESRDNPQTVNAGVARADVIGLMSNLLIASVVDAHLHHPPPRST